MTTEEAIKLIRKLPGTVYMEYCEALEMAVEALQADPFGEFINKEQTLDKIEKYGTVWMQWKDGMSKVEIAGKALKESKAAICDIVRNMEAVNLAGRGVLDQERKKGKWIPVSERLPEVGDTYIVTIEYKGKFEGVDAADFVFTGDGYIDGKWNTWNDWVEDKSEFYHVTAWMPLPDPYMEVNK